MLLSPVMEVALEPAPLGVASLDDPGARQAEILDLCARLGLEALVFESEPRRRRDLLDELRVVEQVGSMEEERDRAALAHEWRRHTIVPAGEIDRAPTRVDVSALADGVCDFEGRVGQRLGDPLPQTARVEATRPTRRRAGRATSASGGPGAGARRLRPRAR